jgi:hypothetical protein
MMHTLQHTPDTDYYIPLKKRQLLPPLAGYMLRCLNSFSVRYFLIFLVIFIYIFLLILFCVFLISVLCTAIVLVLAIFGLKWWLITYMLTFF